MISSIFLDIPSFSLVATFHSSSLFSFISDPAIAFPILQFSSSFFLHILPHSISTQFSSFISFAWFKFMITTLFPSSSSVSSSISVYSFFFSPLFFSPLFLFFLFFFFFLPFLFFFISQCDDFLNFPCHFLGAVLPAPTLYPSLLKILGSFIFFLICSCKISCKPMRNLTEN